MSERIQTIWGTIEVDPRMTLAELVQKLQVFRKAGGHYIVGMTLHVNEADHQPEFDIWDCNTQERYRGTTIAAAWAAFASAYNSSAIAILSQELDECNATGIACADRAETQAE